MSRLLTFLAVVTGLALVLSLYTNINLPVNNQKFEISKAEEAHKAHMELMHELAAGKEEGAQEEVVVEPKTPEIALDTPELKNGAKVFGKCTACHGVDGAGKKGQAAPHLGGQYDWYLLKQLQDMKAGIRINKVMDPTLKGLSDQDMKDVSLYLSKFPWPQAAAAEVAPATK